MLRSLGAGALVFFVFANGAAAEPNGDSPAGVLVLRNGQVLRGVVVPVGDRYQVTLPGGGEIRIPSTSVEMQCRDLAEAYAIKSKTAQRGSASDQLDLAEWCIRHEQYESAAAQLTMALQREPHNPRGLWIERRLKSVGAKPTPSESSPVVLNLHVTLESLEREMRELPTGSVETFTTAVQPLIINRCAANGCHGAATKSDYRLFQPSSGQTLTRRFTQRNLHATLAMVDKQNASDSKLLTVIRDPHGGLPKAVFSEREEASYRLLERWVEQVTRPKPSSPTSLTERNGSLLQTTSATKSNSISQDEGYNKKDIDPSLNSEASGSSAENGKQRKSARGAVQREFSPRDAFDPEVFNRRFFGDEEKK